MRLYFGVFQPSVQVVSIGSHYHHHHHHYHHHHHHPIVNILTDLGAVLYWYTATCVYLLVLMLIAMAMLLVEIDDLANSRQTGNA